MLCTSCILVLPCINVIISCFVINYVILCLTHSYILSNETVQDNKVHGANMGPTWVLSAPDLLHVGPMNLAIRYDCTGDWSQPVCECVVYQYQSLCLPVCESVCQGRVVCHTSIEYYSFTAYIMYMIIWLYDSTVEYISPFFKFVLHNACLKHNTQYLLCLSLMILLLGGCWVFYEWHKTLFVPINLVYSSIGSSLASWSHILHSQVILDPECLVPPLKDPSSLQPLPLPSHTANQRVIPHNIHI